jgi:hypothetical protein
MKGQDEKNRFRTILWKWNKVEGLGEDKVKVSSLPLKFRVTAQS